MDEREEDTKVTKRVKQNPKILAIRHRGLRAVGPQRRPVESGKRGTKKGKVSQNLYPSFVVQQIRAKRTYQLTLHSATATPQEQQKVKG